MIDLMDKERITIVLKTIAEQFDNEYYLQQCNSKGFANPNDDLVRDYVEKGWQKGLNPNRGFDTEYYIRTNPDVLTSGLNPFYHYLTFGSLEGRQPKDSVLVDASVDIEVYNVVLQHFDGDYYIDQALAMGWEPVHEDLVQDYICFGWQNGLDPDQNFDTAYYLAANSDVRENNYNPYYHYLLHGQQEGRLGRKEDDSSNQNKVRISHSDVYKVVSEHFDVEFYISKYLDDEDSIDPIQDYLNEGWKQGRNPSPDFNTDYYLNTNPDLMNVDINPYYHYLLYGANEGRAPASLSRYNVKPQLLDVHKNIPTICLPVSTGKTDFVGQSEQISIAIHLHVYYLEGLETALEYLSLVPGNVSLFITTNTENKVGFINSLINEINLNCHVEVQVVPNRGRDIAPFLLATGEKFKDFDLGLHLHIKYSKEKPEVGQKWFKHNLESLIYDTQYVLSIYELFREFSNCGIVGPEPLDEIKPFIGWGANYSLAQKLFQKIGIPVQALDERELEFPVGTMFWFRPDAIKQLLFDSKLDLEYFPDEPIQDDGTIAHAIERTTSIIARQNGYDSYFVAPLRPAMAVPKDVDFEVSVIIPMYNAEEFIHHAVQSVLLQKSFGIATEVILVDNGSTDSTRDIAKFYAKIFNQVKYFEQEVSGAGAARNMGLKHASGKYVMFLDADDVLDYNAVEELYLHVINSQVDVVVSKLQMFDEYETFAPIPSGYGKGDRILEMSQYTSMGTNYKIEDEVKQELVTVFSDFGPCAKLYRLDFLNRNQIIFPELVNFEDNLFIYEVYLRSKRIKSIDSVTYYYRKYQQLSGKTQSTDESDKAYKEQVLMLERLLAECESITNEQLQNIVHLSIVKKIVWGFDNQVKVQKISKESKNRLLNLIQQLSLNELESEMNDVIEVSKISRVIEWLKV